MALELIFPGILLGYLGSFTLYFVNFERAQAREGFGKKLLGLCLAAHLALLVSMAVLSPGRSGPARDIHVAVFLVLAISYYAETRYRVRYLPLFSLPITLLFGFLALALPRQGAAPVRLPGGEPGLWLHLGLILGGFALLITAACAALMYLVQSRQLKSRHPGRALFSLPDLETLDRLHFRALVWGVVLFSFGVLTGLLRAADLEYASAVWTDPRVILSFVTCGFYWLILALRMSAWRRGHRIAAGTLLILVLLMASWMISYYWPSAFHRGL